VNLERVATGSVGSDDDMFCQWAVYGEDGAVTFLVHPKLRTKTNETACCIGIHSRKKFSSYPRRGRCDVLAEGRCYEEIKLQGAHELWVLSGHGANVAMIWELLDGWYRTMFG